MSYVSKIPEAQANEPYEFLYFEPSTSAIYRSAVAPLAANPIGTTDPTDASWPAGAANTPLRDPIEGDSYINSANGNQYVFTGGAWVKFTPDVPAIGKGPATGSDWPAGALNIPLRSPESGDTYTDIEAGAQYVFYEGEWIMLTPQVNAEGSVRYDAAGGAGFALTLDPLAGPVSVGLTGATPPAELDAPSQGMIWNPTTSAFTISSAGKYKANVSLRTFRDYSVLTPDLDETSPAYLAIFVDGVESKVKQTLRAQYPGYVVDLSGHLELAVGAVVDARITGGLHPTNTINVDYFTLALNMIDFGEPELTVPEPPVA